MAKSQKTFIIEWIFNQRWDDSTQSLSNRIVTLKDISEGIRERNLRFHHKEPMSDKNPANFFKDFTRKIPSANENWPKSVLERGYSGRQLPGDGLCFEFIPIVENQNDAFLGRKIELSSDASIYKIGSASLPLASRQLGRNDENWLLQVLVRLRVIESHFAIFSSAGQFLQVDHLQMNIKQKKVEIDALFSGIREVKFITENVIICCEAKGLKDDILEEQILRQVASIFSMSNIKSNIVIPIAVKAAENSRVHLFEFLEFKKPDFNLENYFLGHTNDSIENKLVLANEIIYEFVPPIPGIGS